MKRAQLLFGVSVAFLFSACARCATHYVSREGSNEAPYLTPETAATSIQSALDVASAGDTVSVAPGEYHGDVLMGPQLVLVGSGPGATSIVGAIQAGEDAEIRQLSVVQKAMNGDAGYFPDLIKGASAGGLTIVGCGLSGSSGTGVVCRMDGGYAVMADSEIRGLTDGIRVSDVYGAGPLVCVVDRCVVEENATGLAAYSGDGVWVMRTRFSGNGEAIHVSGKADVLACSIDGNETGIYLYGGATATLESTALTRNAAYGVDCEDGSRAIVLTNCTITGNRVGLNVEYADRVHARSSIIWGNEQDVRLFALPGWTLDVRYSDLGAAPDYDYVHDEGVAHGNIDADPLFVDAGGGNYRVRPQSPCIDTGSGKNYDAILLRTAYDLDGKRRFVYGGKDCEVDMGAYEYHINRLTPGPAVDQVMLTWSCYYRSEYSIFYSEDLVTWHLADENVPLVGYETASWIDDGSKTGVPPSLAPRRFYRILENP